MKFLEKSQKKLYELFKDKTFSKGKKIVFSISRLVFLFSLCLVLLYPLLIMLSISLREAKELYDPTVIWIPRNFTLKSYIRVIEVLNFKTLVLRTFGISMLATLLQLISTMLAGYGFARFKFPGKNILFGLLIMTIIVPPQIVTIPLTVYFQNFDFFGLGSLLGLATGKPLTVTLLNSYWSYFLPAALGSGIRSGLFVFIFIQFFRGLPRELQDAAYIDGCGRFKTFTKIMIPLSGAAVLTVILFSFVWYWNDSYYSVIFFDNLDTVPYVIQNIRATLNEARDIRDELSLIPQMQASGILSILPLLMLYVFLQKYFTESIERTGIVG